MKTIIGFNNINDLKLSGISFGSKRTLKKGDTVKQLLRRLEREQAPARQKEAIRGVLSHLQARIENDTPKVMDIFEGGPRMVKPNGQAYAPTIRFCLGNDIFDISAKPEIKYDSRNIYFEITQRSDNSDWPNHSKAQFTYHRYPSSKKTSHRWEVNKRGSLNHFELWGLWGTSSIKPFDLGEASARLGMRYFQRLAYQMTPTQKRLFKALMLGHKPGYAYLHFPED